MRSRPATVSLALVAFTLLAGLTVRFAALGLPGGVTKYGGSGLWALTIYWIVSARWRGWRAVAIAEGVTGTVEFAKLYHSPGPDAFRRTLPGVLLLGRIFSWRDLLTYSAAIVLGALVDLGWRSSAERSRLP